jgi:hypothetical protein
MKLAMCDSCILVFIIALVLFLFVGEIIGPSAGKRGKEEISMFTDAQLDDMFTYHDDPAKVPKYQAINEAAKAFAKAVIANTSPCADQTSAIRKIRDARMWANAAIALDGKV